jgi:lipid-binding SYLF domain-containing protein
MQRVSSLLPSWEKRNSGSKGGGIFGCSNRSSAPNPLSKLNVALANNRVQREALWPATLDHECDKAARIVKSFCADGYLPPMDDESLASPPANDHKAPIKLTRKIPKRVLQNAAGIAVFTCMRSGLWMTGSGGSGILIARKSDGTWSPPSGIMLHTPTLSFILGVDVYDCVLVISNLAALESLTRCSVTLGEDVELISGPSVTLDSNEREVEWCDDGNTVLSYVKSRGQLQMVNLNGCILTERNNENVRFYASEVTQMDILAGNVAKHVEETKPLFEVLKLAEGRTDFESATVEKLAWQPAPGDALIATPGSTPSTPRTAFGHLSVHDPDPFGVLALEMAGLEIREAGSRLRPSSSQFDMNAGPLSPAHSKFSRQSVDTYATRSNRGSYMSTRTAKSQVTDVGTQTDVGNTPATTPSPGQSEVGHERSSFDDIPEDKEEEVDYTKVDLTALRNLSPVNPVSDDAEEKSATTTQALAATPVGNEQVNASKPEKKTTQTDENTNDADDEDDEDEEYELDDDEEPVVFEVASVQTTSTRAVASRVIHAKGSVVTIPKRIPPPLPLRNPTRVSQSSKAELGPEFAGLRSPLHQSFTEADMDKEESKRPSASQSSAPSSPKMTSQEKDKPVSLTVQTVTLNAVSSEENQGESKEDAASLSAGSVRSYDNTDHSDSTPGTKHNSFIYNGTSEDRWSLDGSALTTPTCYSIPDDVTGDETPKKDDQVSTKSSISIDEGNEPRKEAVLNTATTVGVSPA